MKRCNVVQLLNNITAEASSDKLLKIAVEILHEEGKIKGKALIDPGSMVSTISKRLAIKYKLKINQSDTIIKTLNRSSVVVGVTDLVKVNTRDHICKMKMYVIDNDYDFILGLNWFNAMSAGLIIREGRPILQFSAESLYLDEDDDENEETDLYEDLEEECLNIEVYEEESELFDSEWTFDEVKLDIGTKIPKIYKKESEKLLNLFKKLGAQDLKSLGHCNEGTHKIRLKDNTPIFKRPYRVSQAEREIINKQVDALLKAGIVRHSKSPWSSPVILVKKKNGSHRLCINYIPLNQVTETEKWPLPRPEEMCERIANSHIYDELDLKDGYYQLPMDEESIDKTAFTTTEGHFEFTRMPFGLKNAAIDFARIMYLILGDLPFVENYVDNTYIHSKTPEEHLENQAIVLDRLNKAGLKLNLSKCSFWKKEIKILGYVVTSGKIKMDLDKVKAISEREAPTNIKQLQSFLGCTNFYRKFIKDYARKVKPLTELLKKETNYIWSPARQEAFSLLKKSLTSYPILRAPDFKRKFFLKTDASHYALGIILGQLDNDNNEYVVAYASKLFKGAELNYSTSRKECLAVVYGIKYFRVYLHGTTFNCFTDHKAIKWLMENKDLSGQFARQAAYIQEFDVKFVHREGSKHCDDDALSRPVLVNVTTAEDPEVVPESLRNDDPYENEHLIHFLKFGRHINGATRKQVNKTNKLLIHYRFANGSIEWRKNEKSAYLTYPKKEERETLIIEYHGKGHFMAHSTYERLSKTYHWRNMKDDIINVINRCLTCIRNNRCKIWNHPALALEINSIHERIHLDLHFGLNPTKEGYVGNLVIIESLSDWPWVRSIKSKNMEEIAGHFLDYIAEFGPPKEIMTDLGKEFTNSLLEEMLKRINVVHKTTSAYNPRVNGKVERFNRTFVDTLRKYAELDPDNWNIWVPFVLIAYRSRVNTTTGFTPHELIFGRSMNEFENWCDKPGIEERLALQQRTEQIKKLFTVTHAEALINIKDKQKYQKEIQNKRQNVLNNELEPGTIVFTKKEGILKKLEPKYGGPYTVVRKTSRGNYELKDATGENLKMAVPLHKLKITKGIENETSKEVKQILDHKVVNGQNEYLVEWADSTQSWVKERDFNVH
jgi:hypothetical protein